MADAMHIPPVPGMWTTTLSEPSILDELAKRKGKWVWVILNTSGSSRMKGKLEEVFGDGIIIGTQTRMAKLKPVLIMLSSIATIEMDES